MSVFLREFQSDDNCYTYADKVGKYCTPWKRNGTLRSESCDWGVFILIVSETYFPFPSPPRNCPSISQEQLDVIKQRIRVPLVPDTLKSSSSCTTRSRCWSSGSVLLTCIAREKQNNKNINFNFHITFIRNCWQMFHTFWRQIVIWFPNEVQIVVIFKFAINFSYLCLWFRFC